MNPIINKGLFLGARQCTKKAFLTQYHPELKTENPYLEAVFRKAKEVEFTAREIFPEGYDVGNQMYKNVNEFIEYTKALASKGTKTIYRGCFEGPSGRCKVDILITGEKKFKIYKVKSNTKVEDEHILELGYQKKILEECYPDKKVETHLIFLNREYVRGIKLDIGELFIIEDITNRSRLVQPLVERNINISQKVLSKESIPTVDIGLQCNKPFECEFKKHCWKKVPENSVFDISRLWEINKFKMYDQGIVELKDVPRQVKLNEKQWMQIDCHVQKRHVIDASAIQEFISDVEYPISFMDFETIMPSIPMFNKTRPYTHIPIQYSVHTLKSPTSEVIHHEFLYYAKSDPRIAFIESLLKVLKTKGTVFVYNQKFEETRLKEIAEVFPKYRKQITNVISRMKDLWTPFEQRYLYHPAQKGSSSLKVVLPAWVPELSYKDLAVFNGACVEEEFHKMVFLRMPSKDKEKIRKDLLEYCKMDTYALVRLLKVLETIVAKSGNNRRKIAA